MGWVIADDLNFISEQYSSVRSPFVYDGLLYFFALGNDPEKEVRSADLYAWNGASSTYIATIPRTLRSGGFPRQPRRRYIASDGTVFFSGPRLGGGFNGHGDGRVYAFNGALYLDGIIGNYEQMNNPDTVLGASVDAFGEIGGHLYAFTVDADSMYEEDPEGKPVEEQFKSGVFRRIGPGNWEHVKFGQYYSSDGFGGNDCSFSKAAVYNGSLYLVGSVDGDNPQTGLFTFDGTNLTFVGSLPGSVLSSQTMLYSYGGYLWAQKQQGTVNPTFFIQRYDGASWTDVGQISSRCHFISEAGSRLWFSDDADNFWYWDEDSDELVDTSAPANDLGELSQAAYYAGKIYAGGGTATGVPQLAGGGRAELWEWTPDEEGFFEDDPNVEIQNSKVLGISMGAYGGSNVAWVTRWASGTLYLEEWNVLSMMIIARHDLGACTGVELDGGTYSAFPYAIDDNNCYVFGRMQDPQSLGDPTHIAHITYPLALWHAVQTGWGVHHCGSMTSLSPGEVFATRNLGGSGARLYIGDSDGFSILSTSNLNAGVRPHGTTADFLDGAVLLASGDPDAVMVVGSPSPYATWHDLTSDHGTDDGVNAIEVL